MLKREELRHINQVAALVAAAMGTAVPANMRRYIYKVKTYNQFAGPNILTIGTGTNVAQEAVIDDTPHAVQYDIWNDPDTLKEDSAPIYILEAGKYIWVTASAGNLEVTLWYVDAP